MSCTITYKGKKYSEEQFKEYFINNKQEFATSIAKNKDVIDSFKRKMEGIDFVFSQSPELASVGSKAQYLQYLSTIFPDSKVKDIVYHGSPSKHDVFKTVDENAREEKFKHIGAMFTSDKNYVNAFGENLYNVVLNIKNPVILSDNTGINSTFVATQYYSVWKNKNKDSVIGHDALLDLDHISEGTEYVVFEPEQIHILGSKQDIEGFKSFIKSNTKTVRKGAITPSIKGHAQFSTDNGIGWFRSDDKDATKIERRDLGAFEIVNDLYTQEFNAEKIETTFFKNGKQITKEEYTKANLKQPEFKTRRILEVQSDLFQKGRDKSDLVTQTEYITELDTDYINIRTGNIISQFDLQGVSNEERHEYEKLVINKEKNKDTNENKFLQLLNKDNNWVTFFVKSIIQDSAKKGYEKVLFPTGNTASKVEGHTTLEEFKKEKEDRIKEIEESLIKLRNTVPQTIEEANVTPPSWNKTKYVLVLQQGRQKIVSWQDDFQTLDAANQGLNYYINNHLNEIAQLKQELENIETQGFGALRPIFNFYENTVTNILKKQKYHSTIITDEYGNTWNEVVINEARDITPVLLSQILDPNALSATVTPGFTVAEENHAVKDVITALFFQIKDQVAEVTIGDVLKNTGNKLRVDIYQALRRHTLDRVERGEATQSEVDAVVKIVDDLKKVNSGLWKKARVYLNINYDVDIEDVDVLKKEGFLEFNHNWDDRKQFSEDPNTTINKQIKKLLALTPQADPTQTIINENNELVFISDRKTFTGIQKLLNFSQVENYLRENLQDASSKEEMLDRLYELGNIHDKSLLYVWNVIRSNEDLLNGFYSSFKTFSPKTSAIFIKGFGEGLQIRTDVSNKDAFNTYSLANNWIDSLRMALLNPENYNEEFQSAYKTVVDELKVLLQFYNADNAKTITDKLVSAFELFGVSLQAKEIDYFINTENHKYTAGLIRGNQSTHANLINEFFMNKLYYLKQYVAYGDPKKDFTEYNRMLELANITKKFRYTNTTATYSNISRNKVYNHIRPNELSYFFDKHKDGGLIDILMNHAKVGKMAYSNWLWNTSKDINNPNGFLDFDLQNGIKTNIRVNTKFYSQFDFARFDGQTNLNTGNAQEYADITENLTKIFKYLLPVVNKGEGVTFYEMFNADSGHTYDITGVKIGVENGNVSKGTEIFKAIKNVIQQELVDIVDATNFVFQVHLTDTGIEIARDENNVPLIREENRNFFISDLHYNYKTNNVFDKNNRPAGSLFKLNIRNAQNETFDDYVRRKSNNQNNFLDDTGIHNLDMGEVVSQYLDGFVEEVIDHIIKTDLKYNENNRVYLENAVDSFGTKLLDKYGSYENFIKEYSLNSYINMAEIRNFFGASNNELSSTIEYGKRANELTRGGIIGASKNTYRSVTISPVKLQGTVYESLVTQGNKVDNSTVKAYKSFDVADGFSAITLEEFERRMLSQGRLAEFADLIADLRNPNTPLNVESLTKIQQQKNFYYHYIFDPKVNRFVAKHVKNSEIILVPKAVKNVELGALYKWMNKNNVGQVDFTSSVKRGARKVVTIHNEATGKMLLNDKGNFTSEVAKNLQDAIDIQYYEHLRTQQIIPDHAIDEVNKLGVQLSKVIFNNINSTDIYTINGKRYTGLELKQHYFNLLTNNIKESGISVLARFGVKTTKYGSLEGLTDADIKRISDILLEETINRQGNIGDIFANSYNEEINDTNLPIYWGVGLDKNISLLTSIWTNNVTIQELPGIHSTLTASVFQNSLRFNKSNIDFANPTAINGVNYLNEIHERNDYRLRANLINNNRVLEAEVLLPAWTKKFFDADNNVIDINIINEQAPELLQLMGNRIPFEGKHSAIAFKVVGFLPPSLGSRVILPDDFVIKSGADFDIDSLYIFTKSFNRKIVYPTKDYTSQEFKDFVVQQLAENNFKRRRGKKIVTPIFDANVVRELANSDEEWLTRLNQGRYSIEETTDVIEYKGQKYPVINKYETVSDLAAQGEYTETAILKTIMTRYNNFIKNQKPEYIFEPITTDLTDQQYYDKVMEIYHSSIGKEIVRNSNLQSKVVLASAETTQRVDQNDLISILDLAKLFVDNRLIPTKEEFATMSDYEKLTRTQRNNEIIDIFRSILLNSKHYSEQHKPVSTNTSDIDKAISRLKNIDNTQNEYLDPNIAAHNDIIKQRNLTVRGLKGISVAMDGFFSIAQLMQSYISANNEDFAPYVSYKIEKNQLNRYEEIYGDDVINFDPKTSIITIAHRDLYRRKDNTFLNFDNERITDIAAQATAAILDAVKKPLPTNVNDYTIGVWKLFSALGVGHGWDYSTIFINQPIVKDITDLYYKNKSSFSTGNEKYNVTEVKAVYTYELFKAINDYYKLEGKYFAPRVKDWTNYKYNILEKQVEEGRIYLTTDEFKKMFNFDYNVKQGFTLEALENMITYRNKNYDKTNTQEELKKKIAYLQNQLVILQQFSQLKQVSEEITTLTNTYNTDKSGAGPSLENTIERERNLVTDEQNKINSIRLRGTEVEMLSDAAFKLHPALETWRIWSNLASYAILSPFDLRTTEVYQNYINAIPNAKTVKNKAFQYFIGRAMEGLPFFNKVDSEVLLGINSDQFNIKLNTLVPSNISKFRKLSLANQIYLLQKQRTDYLQSHQHNSLLNYIKLRINPREIENNKYQKVDFTFDGRDINPLIEETHQWYFGDDVYLKEVVKNLIRYAYFTNGYTFTYGSFAKVIHPEILARKVKDGGIGFSHYLRTQYNRMNDSIEGATIYNDDFILRFLQNNWDNTRLVPLVVKRYTKEGKVNKYKPTYSIRRKTIEDKNYDYVRISRSIYERDVDYNEYPIIRIKTLSDKPKIMSMNFEGQFEKIVESNKTQTTRISDQTFKIGDVVNVWNGGELTDGGVKYKYDRFKKEWLEYTTEQGWKKVTSANSTRLTEKYGDPNLYISVEITNVEEAPANELYNKIANLRIDDDYFTKEGRPGIEGRADVLRNLKYFTSEKNKNKNAQVISFKKHGNIRTNPISTVESDRIFKRFYPILDGDSASYVYFYPVNKLMGNEYTEQSRIADNNEAISELDYIMMIEQDYDEIRQITNQKPEEQDNEDIELKSQVVDPFVSGSRANAEKVKNVIDFVLGNMARFQVRGRILNKDGNVREVNEQLNKIFIDALKDGEKEQILIGLKSILTYYQSTIGNLFTRLNYYDDDTAYTEMLKSKDDRKRFLKTLRYAHLLIQGFKTINTLETLRDENDKDIDKLILSLKEWEAAVSSINSLYGRLVKRYFEDDLTKYSTNPEITAQLRTIFDPQRDLNSAERWLDSIGDTENTFVANLYKKYVIAMYKANKEIKEEIVAFDKIWKNFVAGRNIDEVTKEFVDLFITKDSEGNPTGRLIAKYNYDAFFKAKKEMRDRMKLAKTKGARLAIYRDWYANHEILSLKDDSGLTPEELIEIKKAELSNTEFRKWKLATFKLDKKTGKLFFKGVPNEKLYANPAYEKVKDNPLYQYLTTNLPRFMSYFEGKGLGKGFLPVLPQHEGISWLDKISYKAGYFARKNSTFLGEDNEIIHYLDMPMLKALSLEKPFKIPAKKPSETELNYQARVVRMAKEAGFGDFKTFQEIEAKNDEIRKANTKVHGTGIVYNLEQVMHNFINEIVKYKYKRELEAEFYTAKNFLKEEMTILKRDAKGKSIMDQTLSTLTGQSQYAVASASGSNIDKRLEDFLRMVFYEEFELDEGKLTKIARVFQNYTSAKNMWWNLPVAFNNVAMGQSQIFMERAAGYFWGNEDSNAAEAQFWSALPAILSSLGENSSSNIDAALLKYFDITAYQDEKNLGDNAEKSILHKHLLSTDAFYILHHIGEYYMQNKGLLAMLNSHRIVNGKIVSFVEYTNNLREQALQKIVSPEIYAEFVNYRKITFEKDKYEPENSQRDYIRDFILKNLTKEQISNFIAEEKELKKQAKEAFSKFTKVRDAFDLDSEKGLKLKDGIELGENEEALFVNKVLHVNQKLHGIYNTTDAGAVQKYALGRLVVQFRKWMRPGWNKRWGSKFGSQFWNEQRNEVDKGSYISMWQFLTKPIKDNLNGDVNENHFITLKAVQNILRDYVNYFGNIQLHWGTLNDFEKANIRRALAEMLMFAGLLAIGWVLGNMKEDDDSEVYVLNMMLYMQDRMVQELLFYNPYGWINQTKQILRSPAAAWGGGEDILKFLIYATAYPFQDEEDRMYDRGPYKGQTKVGASFEKLIPIMRQVQKMKRFEDYSEYYKLFNPL